MKNQSKSWFALTLSGGYVLLSGWAFVKGARASGWFRDLEIWLLTIPWSILFVKSGLSYSWQRLISTSNQSWTEKTLWNAPLLFFVALNGFLFYGLGVKLAAGMKWIYRKIKNRHE